MKDKNIKAKLKDHLLQGKKITPLQAWRRWGTSRLAVYVRRLRIEGWNIETTIKAQQRRSIRRVFTCENSKGEQDRIGGVFETLTHNFRMEGDSVRKEGAAQFIFQADRNHNGN